MQEQRRLGPDAELTATRLARAARLLGIGKPTLEGGPNSAEHRKPPLLAKLGQLAAQALTDGDARVHHRELPALQMVDDQALIGPQGADAIAQLPGQTLLLEVEGQALVGGDVVHHGRHRVVQHLEQRGPVAQLARQRDRLSGESYRDPGLLGRLLRSCQTGLDPRGQRLFLGRQARLRLLEQPDQGGVHAGRRRSPPRR